ncbi:hypothetical protein [Chondromyces crocatus]|uniref:Transcriptional regulator n=1 Tax=Chondromyces crocatus TaxID=52 RepID=A0A0K1EIJ0_CHOCO|nr:hypothetical protein [Chondromyces crocatus]AKT40676.1 transcriptional regulator [Chondromyces crocatus]
MTLPRTYRNYAEFERDYLCPSRVSFSLEDIVEEGAFDAELDFEKDRFDGSDDDY